MKNWKKDRNCRAFKNADGGFTYVITVNGEDVGVSAEVYEAYSHSARQLEYIEHDLKRDRVLRDKDGKSVLDAHGNKVYLPELEVSLDKLMDEDWDFAADGPQPEDDVICRMELADLRRCLGMIDDSERELIQTLIFERKTEREYAAETGMSQQKLHARKLVILDKLKKLLKSKNNFCQNPFLS